MATPHGTPAHSRAHPQGSEGPPPRPTSHTTQNPTRGTQEDNPLLLRKAFLRETQHRGTQSPSHSRSLITSKRRTTYGTPGKANLSLQNTPHPTGPGWGSRCGRRIHPRACPASLCTGLHGAPLAAASHLPGSEAPATGLQRPVRVSARLPPASALKACSWGAGGAPTARTRPHSAGLGCVEQEPGGGGSVRGPSSSGPRFTSPH